MAKNKIIMTNAPHKRPKQDLSVFHHFSSLYVPLPPSPPLSSSLPPILHVFLSNLFKLKLICFLIHLHPWILEATEMGSKGGAAPAPPPAICCMCGDHGLPQELFRCKLCLVRSQHKYCSNLYPKVESYRACNWCLKQEAAAGIVATKDDTSLNNNISGSSSAVKLNRGAFPQHLNKAVKKQKVVQERSPAPNKTDRPVTRSEEVSPRLGKGKQAFRGKVRRYKLLEEVSS